jgi:16S rRNA (guanine966-N2)-methyltransferase
MRVIAGSFKGRSLKTVPGRETRPTTDRVREAWASTICSLLSSGFTDLRVLDAFAGSGALGIEALSRGAASSIFVERAARAQETIRANLAVLGLGDSDRALLVPRDVFSPASLKALVPRGPFGLVILDPPYELAPGRVRTLLGELALVGVLGPGALLSYEQASGSEESLDGAPLGCACSPLSLKMVSCKTYGTTQLRYYTCH